MTKLKDLSPSMQSQYEMVCSSSSCKTAYRKAGLKCLKCGSSLMRKKDIKTVDDIVIGD